jgi:hypothetical protein
MSSPSPESILFTKLFLFGTEESVDYLSPDRIRLDTTKTPWTYNVNEYMAGPAR